MNYIQTIIKYRPAAPTAKKLSLVELRADRKARGVCMQCGSERPCPVCAERSRTWRKRQK